MTKKLLKRVTVEYWEDIPRLNERCINKTTKEETWPGSTKTMPGEPYETYRSEII